MFEALVDVHLSITAPVAGITNYPIGVGINAAGEITIADNHNNFNLTVFSQDGQLISALESKVGLGCCLKISSHREIKFGSIDLSAVSGL